MKLLQQIDWNEQWYAWKPVLAWTTYILFMVAVQFLPGLWPLYVLGIVVVAFAVGLIVFTVQHRKKYYSRHIKGKKHEK